MVTTMPPGSLPGMIAFASAPTMRPTMRAQSRCMGTPFACVATRKSAGADQPIRRDGDALAWPERRESPVDEFANPAIVEADDDLVRALLGRALTRRRADRRPTYRAGERGRTTSAAKKEPTDQAARDRAAYRIAFGA